MSRGGLRFGCTQCGHCCTTRGEYAYVYVNAGEAEPLAATLGLSAEDFRERFTFVDEEGLRQLHTRDGHCTFLDPETNACRVYEARPVQCRTFPFWPEYVRAGQWTREAREHCEGVGEGPVHPPEEVRAQVRAMRDWRQR